MDANYVHDLKPSVGDENDLVRVFRVNKFKTAVEVDHEFGVSAKTISGVLKTYGIWIHKAYSVQFLNAERRRDRSSFRGWRFLGESMQCVVTFVLCIDCSSLRFSQRLSITPLKASYLNDITVAVLDFMEPSRTKENQKLTLIYFGLFLACLLQK